MAPLTLPVVDSWAPRQMEASVSAMNIPPSATRHRLRGMVLECCPLHAELDGWMQTSSKLKLLR